MQRGSLISGTLLLTGTCVGAGMLAIPIATGVAGFVPALAINVLCWIVMLATGLLFLEATLAVPDGSNVLSMSRKCLGWQGQWLAGGFFLFLYGSLMVAYLTGGAPQLQIVLGITSDWAALALFTFIFGGIVAISPHCIGRVNSILMAGLVISYVMLIGIGASEVNTTFYEHADWSTSFFAAPILFAAYGYHNVIPSISSYLGRDKRKLIQVIIFGTALPFIIYTLWQWLVMGIVPIDELQGTTVPINEVLYKISGNHFLGQIALFFGFFALTTSLLGVAFSMVDFLADGINCKRTGIQRIGLTSLVFIPPLLIGMFYPNIFVSALSIAGGIGEAFLNCLLPIALVWVLRKENTNRCLFGGKAMLISLTLITFAIMGTEIYRLWV